LEVTVFDERREGKTVQQKQRAGWHALGCSSPRGLARPRRDQPEQVGRRGRIELEYAGEGFEHLCRRRPVASLLDAQVVVRADAGQRGNFLAPQTRGAPPTACCDTDLLGSHLFTTRPQVRAERVLAVHILTIGRGQPRRR
jgi:hypothetical protein